MNNSVHQNDPSPVLKQFDYRPRKWQSVLLFFLACMGSVLLTYFAIYLDRPVDALGFQLNPILGRLLFRVAAALSPIGLFCLGALVYVAFVCDRRVALTNSHVILPKPTRMGLSREEIEIPLNTISLVSVRDFIGATKLLRLDHSGGVVNIPSNMFRSSEIFSELCRDLQEAVDNATRLD